MSEISSNEQARTISWPDPTDAMIASPVFEAIWQTIKTWDVAVPAAYSGYCGATGNHVRAIMDALRIAESGALDAADKALEHACDQIRHPDQMIDDAIALIKQAKGT